MRRWSFTKGHGTGNDFVLILDRESMLEISPEDVRQICDRHLGVGADGLLRAVLARNVGEWTGDGSVWFMDYRNADGSPAEMCGNGARVFVRYLLDNDLAIGPTLTITTRSGLREATVLADGRIRVEMGPVTVGDTPTLVRTVAGEEFKAVPADVGNPHAVSFTDDLGGLRLYEAPRWAPVDRFPNGVNQEFVSVVGEHHIAMRVFERGSGETRSCGTGTVAAAAAAHARAADAHLLPVTYRVDVPGGTVHVELTPDQAYLSGPAVLVVHGDVIVPREMVRREAPSRDAVA
jgi:diaminopimelate epimerase